MKSKIENCLYMQVAHCNKCGGQSGYNIVDGEKVCFDCGEPYEADFSVSKVESTITTTNSQDQEEEWYCECGEPANQGEHICKDTPEEWVEKQRNLVEKAQRKYYDFRRQEKFLIDDVDIYKNTREYVENELVEDIINLTKSLLDEKEREGYQNCMDDIWEKARGLRSWTEHDGSVSAGDIEAGLREAYLEIEEELSKLSNK